MNMCKKSETRRPNSERIPQSEVRKGARYSRALATFAFLLSVILHPLSLLSAPVEFHSQWDKAGNRVWVGEAYWANPLQDWRLQDGQLICTPRGEDRNVHLLTWQLIPESTLTMRINAKKLDADFHGWFGFRFSIYGTFDEYRHNVVQGEGMDVGLTSDGRIFIGRSNVTVRLPAECTLELSLTPVKKNHLAVLTALDQNGQALGKVQSYIRSDEIHGNLALVCHLDGKTIKANPVYKPAVAFSDWRIQGENLRGGLAQNWGPILWSQYGLSQGVLKVAVQFPPLGEQDARKCAFEVMRVGEWRRLGEADIDEASRLALFRFEHWDAAVDLPYRIVYPYQGRDREYLGVIRHDPVDKAEMVMAGVADHNDYAFPDWEVVDDIHRINPDLLFFAGNQVMEKTGGYGLQRTPTDMAVLDYLRKWYLLGWAFGDVLRDRPSVFLPGDRDYYQGNLWGAGGRATKREDDGGFTMPPEWIKVVERTQMSHLPDPVDPRPVEQDIGVHFTSLTYGRVSFALLEDRKFKSGPVNMRTAAERAQAQLLGDRQMAFIKDWAQDWRGCDFKAALTHSLFAKCQTHGDAEHRPVERDTESNAWPSALSNDALRELRKGFALLCASGDGLPVVVHHGIDGWEDAGIGFGLPSLAVGTPRAWLPEDVALGRQEGFPEYAAERFKSSNAPPYLGRYTSALNHPVTILAVANPKLLKPRASDPIDDLALLDDKSSGFGVVRFNKETGKILLKCYHLLANPMEPETAQADGWPVEIDPLNNYNRAPVAWLPKLEVEGAANPVLQVIDEQKNEVIYTLRIRGTGFQPWTFAEGKYTVKIGQPPQEFKTLPGLGATKAKGKNVVKVSLK